MPEKKLGARVKRAKREGRPVAVKASDVGRGPVSRHAGKKSRHVMAYARTADRNAQRKRPPGEGRSHEAILITPRIVRPGRPADSVPGSGVRKDRYGRMGGIVQGRKKAPSRMGVKQKGGPRSQSRLRGGGRSGR